MTRRTRPAPRYHRAAALTLALALGGALYGVAGTAAAVDYPVTSQQRSTANQVASAGVALSELAPHAPDVYTVKRGDTLWAISRLFLRSPWRWPELWGMNLDDIRNPHLIYPGQVLVLDKSNGRARLKVAQSYTGGPGDTVKLSPRVRASEGADGIPSIDLNLIEPFLNEAVIFDTDALATSPRIVAAQEGRVMLSRGDTAYVRGDLGGARNFRVFRNPRALVDPTTKEVLGYEAVYVGTAEFVRRGDGIGATQTTETIPDTFTLTSIRQEAMAGDRLSPVPSREFINYVPRAPKSPITGQIVSVYGEALTAGQNQIVALNKGARDGLETGNVLALWRDGERVIDATDPNRPTIKLPDERHGLLFVFRVFDRMSYALILSVNDPVRPGDRYTQP
jgi:LysM repeat protein